MKACPAACNGRDVASAMSRGTCNHECSWNNHIPSQEAIDKWPAPEKTLSRQWSRLCTPRPREQKLRNRNHMKAVEYANHTYSKRDQNKGFPAHHSMKAAKFVVFSSIHHLSYRKNGIKVAETVTRRSVNIAPEWQYGSQISKLDPENDKIID